MVELHGLAREGVVKKFRAASAWIEASTRQGQMIVAAGKQHIPKLLHDSGYNGSQLMQFASLFSTSESGFMKRYITLVDTEGCLAAIIPFDPNDRSYDELTGTKLGSTSLTPEDKAHIMEAYGSALVDNDRKHVSYVWTADKGADRLEIDVIRFPEVNVSAMLLSVVIPKSEATQKLTKREQRIVQLAAEDHSDSEIAAKLKIAKSTVSRHKQNIRSKLGAKEWAGAVAKYIGLDNRRIEN